MACPTVSGIPSLGTLVKYGDCGSPETYRTVAGAGDISGPDTTRTVHETTNHGTGAVAPRKTWVPTITDDGSLTFPINYNPADSSHDNVTGLEYLSNLGGTVAIRNWRLVAPDPSATTMQFQGFVEKLTRAYPVQGILTRTVTIRVTSAPVYI